MLGVNCQWSGVSDKGFTLIELITVLGIVFIIVAAAAPIYGNLQSSTQLSSTSSQAVQALRMARERSVNRYNDKTHGVKFDVGNNKFILYQGISYAARDVEFDRETSIPRSLTVTTPEGDDINFSMGLGILTTEYSINISRTVTDFDLINVNKYGVVTEN